MEKTDEFNFSKPNTDDFSLKLTNSKPALYANAAVNAESSKSAAEYANDWLEYLKDTPQANEIFKSLERIARLEERKHYLCDSFDVSF